MNGLDNPQLWDLLIMVINHLLTGMILQMQSRILSRWIAGGNMVILDHLKSLDVLKLLHTEHPQAGKMAL